MTCEQVRWLLALEPRDRMLPEHLTVRQHLDRCPACREYWQALQRIDAALAARPLAMLPAERRLAVMAAVRRHPRPAQIPPMFSRAFVMFSAAITLFALVGGAVLLQYCSAEFPLSSPIVVPSSMVNPGWASAASTWLSLRSDQVGQAVLALLAGLLICVLGYLAGHRATGSPMVRLHAPRADASHEPHRFW
jgi:anti-sigma factor RsiW